MALVIRRVDYAPLTGCRLCDLDVCVLPVYLAEQRVEGMLQSPIHPVALSGPKLIEVGMDAFPRLTGTLAVAPLQVTSDFFTTEHRLGYLILRHARTIPPRER